MWWSGISQYCSILLGDFTDRNNNKIMPWYTFLELIGKFQVILIYNKIPKMLVLKLMREFSKLQNINALSKAREGNHNSSVTW